MILLEYLLRFRIAILALMFSVPLLCVMWKAEELVHITIP